MEKFKHGGLHEKHAVATWNLGSHLNICLNIAENQENQPVLRWPSGWSVGRRTCRLLTDWSQQSGKLTMHIPRSFSNECVCACVRVLCVCACVCSCVVDNLRYM